MRGDSRSIAPATWDPANFSGLLRRNNRLGPPVSANLPSDVQRRSKIGDVLMLSVEHHAPSRVVV